jgi:signal transduction histidine kinase
LLQAACKGVIAGAILTAAGTMLAEAEEQRRQDALVLIAQTEQWRVEAEKERAKIARQVRAELERELLTIKAQITQAEINLTTSQGGIAAMHEELGTLVVSASTAVA